MEIKNKIFLIIGHKGPGLVLWLCKEDILIFCLSNKGKNTCYIYLLLYSEGVGSCQVLYQHNYPLKIWDTTKYLTE